MDCGLGFEMVRIVREVKRERKLVGLKKEIWRRLLSFLSTYELGRLVLTGSKMMIHILDQNVIEFKHHPRGIRRKGWPFIISLFTRLKTFEISSFDPTFPPPYITGVDLSSIPRSIRSLKLLIANGFFVLLQSPSLAQLLSLNFSILHTLPSYFPKLRELRWLDTYQTSHSPFSLRPFVSLPLTCLHLPSTPALTPTSIALLPTTLTDLRCTASAHETQWAHISFPSPLLRLTIDQFPAQLASFALPQSLVSLKLATLIHTTWIQPNMPKSLRKLSIVAPSLILPLRFFSSLPKNLKGLVLHVERAEIGFECLLPLQIQKFHLRTSEPLSDIPWHLHLPQLIEGPSWIMAKSDQLWKTLPRTLERTLEPELFLIPSFPPSIIHDLPHRLTEAYFDGVPAILPFAYLKHLHIEARNDLDFDRIGLLLSGGLIPTLRKLTIGGIYMKDPSVLEKLEGSTVKELVIAWCDPKTWSRLSQDWSSSLESLTIKKGPWTPCRRVWRDNYPLTEEGGEQWDFQMFWPIHLRHSLALTHLSLGPGCLQLFGDPSFVPTWPCNLKSLVLYDALPILSQSSFYQEKMNGSAMVVSSKSEEGPKSAIGASQLNSKVKSTRWEYSAGLSSEREVKKVDVDAWKIIGSEIWEKRREGREINGLWSGLPSSLLHLDIPVYGADLAPASAFRGALDDLPKGLLTLRLQGIQLGDLENISSQVVFHFLQSPSHRLHALYDTSKMINWLEHMDRPSWDEELSIAIDSKRSTTLLAPYSSPPSLIVPHRSRASSSRLHQPSRTTSASKHRIK